MKCTEEAPFVVCIHGYEGEGRSESSFLGVALELFPRDHHRLRAEPGAPVGGMKAHGLLNPCLIPARQPAVQGHAAEEEAVLLARDVGDEYCPGVSGVRG